VGDENHGGSSMIAINTAALLLCGLAMFFCFRRTANAVGRLDRWLLAAAFLVRAVGGLAAFVISNWHLPFLRSLQAGHGLWFFAYDARAYHGYALELLSDGFWGIFTPERWFVPSVLYVQFLAAAEWLFGMSVATGILLNLVAWLGIAAIVVFWDPAGHGLSRGARLVLIVLAFSPSAVLWSVQPLKDPMFQLCLIAVGFGLIRIGQAWEDSAGGAQAWLFGTVIYLGAVWGAVGVRWYFIVYLVAGTVLFAALQLRRVHPGRRPRFALFSTILIVMSILVGSASQQFVVTNMFWRLAREDRQQEMPTPTRVIESRRRAFESMPARTQIRPGPLLRRFAPEVEVETKQVQTTENWEQQPKSEWLKRRRAETIKAGEVSTMMGLICGAIASVVPKTIAQGVGLIEISGGRGLWLVADLDTLWFDWAIGLAIVAIWSRRKLGVLSDPMIVWAVFLFLCVGGTFVAVVTNFGTLFRHRGMFVVFAAVIPLIVEARRSRVSADSKTPV